jgi:glucan endo-1,3-beta-D-glucosidase
VRVQSDFEALYQTAAKLVGTDAKFTSARLYTMIQGGTDNSPIEAIPAAIAQGTSLLLGLWASGGADHVTQEITALKSAISTYGDKFTSLVVGISVGSEDLYRDSITGQQANAGIGAGPDVILSYINQVKSAISGTSLSAAPIGHVDTWTAWVNSSNTEVINALDWIGHDAYPYFQNTQQNSIDNAKSLFLQALDNTKGAVGSKPVWVTETGWPTTGKTEGYAVPSVQNAQTYWNQVACPLLGATNTWWYTLEDNDNATPNPQFGVTNGLSTTPYYDLSCTNITSASSSSSSSASGTATGSSGSAAATSVSVVSSGGGLSPTGAGNGIGSASVTTTAITSAATGSSGNSGSGSGSGSGSSAGNSTVTTAKISGTATGSGSKSSATVVATNGAPLVSGSFFGVIGALLAAFAAL